MSSLLALNETLNVFQRFDASHMRIRDTEPR